MIARWLMRGSVVERGREGEEGEGGRLRRSDVSIYLVAYVWFFVMLMDCSRRMLVLPLQPQHRVCPSLNLTLFPN